ncbi:MAG: hypothetical protein K0U52_12050 [Gammaproteobacteria bacterium]|nr:hypothetical protein [Gammaproteobacteria bacterium]
MGVAAANVGAPEPDGVIRPGDSRGADELTTDVRENSGTEVMAGGSGPIGVSDVVDSGPEMKTKTEGNTSK